MGDPALMSSHKALSHFARPPFSPSPPPSTLEHQSCLHLTQSHHTHRSMNIHPTKSLRVYVRLFRSPARQHGHGTLLDTTHQACKRAPFCHNKTINQPTNETSKRRRVEKKPASPASRHISPPGLSLGTKTLSPVGMQVYTLSYF